MFATRTIRSLLVVIAAVLVFGRPDYAAAQCDQWIVGPGQAHPGADGEVLAAVEWDADGPGPMTPVLILGGRFHALGVTAARFLAQWDGSEWSSPFPVLDGPVTALTVRNGRLIVAGAFSRAADTETALRGVAAWDGSAWSALGDGLDPRPSQPLVVRSLLDLNSRFIAIGNMGPPTGPIAEWTGESWLPLGAPIEGEITAACIHNNELIAIGAFRLSSTGPWLEAAAFDGSTWRNLGEVPGVRPFSIASSAGALYVCSEGGRIIGADWFYRVRWTGEGFEIIEYAPGLRVDLIGEFEGRLWASVTSAGPYTIGPSSLAFLEDGTWRSQGEFSSGPIGLIRFHEQLFAHGAFSTIGLPPESATAIAVQDGGQWRPLWPGTAGPLDIAAWFGERILTVRERFSPLWDVDVPTVDEFDGEHWREIGSGSETSFFSGTAEFGGAVHIFGSFNQFAGFTYCIARWDGLQWGGLPDPPFGFVQGMAGESGRTLASGVFYVFGDHQPAPLISAAGGAWQPVLPPTIRGIGGPLLTHAGTTFFGGAANEATGEVVFPASRFDGSNWIPLGGGLDGVPRYLIACQQGLLAVGGFQRAEGQETRGWAIWNGSAWAPFLAPLSADDTARIAALQAVGDSLIAGGNFAILTPDGMARNVIAFDGVAWHPLREGVDGPVRSLSVRENLVMVGGRFATAGGRPAAGVAYVSCQPGTGCPSDMNRDGGVDGADVETFFLAWASGESAGDFNRDGGVDGADVDAFFLAWEAGC